LGVAVQTPVAEHLPFLLPVRVHGLSELIVCTQVPVDGLQVLVMQVVDAAQAGVQAREHPPVVPQVPFLPLPGGPLQGLFGFLGVSLQVAVVVDESQLKAAQSVLLGQVKFAHKSRHFPLSSATHWPYFLPCRQDAPTFTTHLPVVLLHTPVQHDFPWHFFTVPSLSLQGSHVLLASQWPSTPPDVMQLEFRGL